MPSPQFFYYDASHYGEVETDYPCIIFRRRTDLEIEDQHAGKDAPPWADSEVVEVCKARHEDEAQKIVVALNDTDWHDEAWTGLRTDEVLNDPAP